VPGTIRRQVENAIDSLVNQASKRVLPAVPKGFTARPLNAAAIKDAFSLAASPINNSKTTIGDKPWSPGL
jgi:hypothetical protein